MALSITERPAVFGSSGARPLADTGYGQYRMVQISWSLRLQAPKGRSLLLVGGKHFQPQCGRWQAPEVYLVFKLKPLIIERNGRKTLREKNRSRCKPIAHSRRQNFITFLESK
jgi:hypothetical protein